MASEKNVVLVLTECNASALDGEACPTLNKIRRKGTLLHLEGQGRDAAVSGSGQGGEPLWEAAQRDGLRVVGPAPECPGDGFDLCVLDIPGSAAGVERALAPVMDIMGRSTVYALLARDAVLFCGPGFARDKEVDSVMNFSCVAPTLAYVADLPIPAMCTGAVAYAALKDPNYKLNEIRRLQTTIANMESAMERKARQPWDKHDCA